jgi:hypothetical protein
MFVTHLQKATLRSRAALFGSRSELAKKFEGLGLHVEADIITHSDEQFHFTFLVANKVEIMDSFEFSNQLDCLVEVRDETRLAS